MAESMKRTMDSIRRFLDVRGWHYVECGDDTLRGIINGESCRMEWMAHAEADPARVSFHTYVSTYIRKKRRLAVAEYLTRVNCGLSLAAMELDWGDGQVLCRTAAPLAGDVALATKVIEHLLYGNLSVMDRYLPGLMDVAFANRSPRRAAQKADGQSSAAVLPDETLTETPAKPTIVRRFAPGTN